MNKRTVYILAALLLTAAGCQGQQPLTQTESSRASIQTVLPESNVPASSIPASSVSASSIPESSVPESSVPASSIPASSIPSSSVPASSIPASSVPESSVPVSSVSESSVPEFSMEESSREEPSTAPQVRKTIVNPYKPYTADRIQKDIEQLCRRYSGLITQYAIGLSTQGRLIFCVTLGHGRKKGCIVSGIHAREHITSSFSMRCIEELAEAYQNNEWYGEYNVRQLLQEYTLYFVPMCNPDGTGIAVNGAQPLVYGQDFRPDEYKLNGNGVNLNRNFPYNWENQYTHQTTVPGDEKYAGARAGSEKETQAIMSLCAEENFSWLLDMHIVGNGIYWRDEMNGPIEGDSRLRDAITERCGYRYFGVSSDVTIYSGGLENWFRYTYHRPALCIEMVPYEQAQRVETYIGLNDFFEEAVNWPLTKYTYLEAMVSG